MPYSEPVANDAFDLDFDPNNPPAPPVDSDEDGMPDAWESQHGLNPNGPDHNGTELSVAFTGVPGYTNLECYLNWLSDRLTAGAVPAPIYLPLITDTGAELHWTTDPANCCYAVHRSDAPDFVPSEATATFTRTLRPTSATRWWRTSTWYAHAAATALPGPTRSAWGIWTSPCSEGTKSKGIIYPQDEFVPLEDVVC